MKNKFIPIILILILISACGSGTNKRFELLDPETTGFNFTNTIPENDTLNQFTYHYLYNGNGVATADLDKDGLAEIVITGNNVPAKIYKNNGNFKFEDITDKAGLKTTGWMTGVSIADVNNDNLPDIYICRSGPWSDSARKKNYLFINKGNLVFKEEAELWGIADAGNSTTANFFDMDNDGDLDVYVGNHSYKYFGDIDVPYSPKNNIEPKNQQRLYKNEGNKFVNVTENAGVGNMGYCLSATAADFNRDGFIDLYINNDYHIPDFYFENQGNGTFVNKLTEFFKHTSTNAMGADITDINHDGWIDFFQVDMLNESPQRYNSIVGPKNNLYMSTLTANGYSPQYMKNSLQLNQGKGYFSDVAHLAGIAKTDWSWSPLWVDLDNDGLQDLFISNGYYRDVTDLDFMFYYDRDIVQKKESLKVKSITEKLPFNKIENYTYKNKGNLEFEKVINEWGIDAKTLSTGSSTADLNGDGLLDIIICNQGEPAMLYKNKGDKANYARVKLEGIKNTAGIGVKLFVKTAFGTQIIENVSTKGYQSSSEAIVHIGLGAATNIEEIVCVWPGGKKQIVKNIKGNELTTIFEKNATETYDFALGYTQEFSDLTAILGLNFKHQEMPFPDFEGYRQLPHRYSYNGPGSAVADVNGDGRMDYFVGNGRGSSGAQLFLQNAAGSFSPAPTQPWKLLNQTDMMGMLFFDADKDGDMDLYCSAGGSEIPVPTKSYVHALYTNDGKGNFTINTKALPAIDISASCVVGGDVDSDGDIDLFVGGRVMPGLFSITTIRSFLLINNNGVFVDATKQACPQLETPGMVTSACFVDYNGDSKLDLVLTGEYLPIAIFENTGKGLVYKTNELGLSSKFGWFNSIYPLDFDNDGDCDFVVGNKGDNSYFTATDENKLRMYFNDLDGNNTPDMWFTREWEGKEYPYYQLDEMAETYPTFLRKNFISYKKFSTATVSEVFGKENIGANQFTVNEFSNLLLVNNGNNFTYKDLPKLAQSGPIFGFAVSDIDENGFLDVLLAGNSYATRATHGPDDAINSQILYNTNGDFKVKNGQQSGFNSTGDGKSLAIIPVLNKQVFVSASNNTALKAFATNQPSIFVPALPLEHSAMVTLTNGSKQWQFTGAGAGYLSQSAQGVFKTKNVKSITFINSLGQKRTVN